MLTQLLLVAGATAGLSYYRATMDKRLYKPYIQKWNTLMESSNIKNNLNITFTPLRINILEHAIVYTLNIPAGLTVDKLESIKEAIDSYFKGVTTIKKVKFTDYCIVKIITKNLSDYEFEPIKCSESELFIGKSLDIENYKIDLTKAAAHLLIGAPSGKGKSFLLASILTNLIYNSSDMIDLYLLQIKKGDVGIFEHCKPVKYTAYTLEEVAWGLEKLVTIADERDKKFNSLGVKNLKHYNKHYPKRKMKRIYTVTEEISFFMPNDTDNDNIKKLKERCLEALKTLVKAGRSSGVHIISVCQRSTIENIPSTMKSMMIRISLGQLSAIDSKNIIESNAAIYLENKECLVYGYEPEQKTIKIPTIDEDFLILHKYIKEIKIPEVISTKSKEAINNNNSTKTNIIPKITSSEIKNDDIKNDGINFIGPEFKILEESAVDSTKENKKIIKRKGVYIEEESEDYTDVNE